MLGAILTDRGTSFGKAKEMPLSPPARRDLLHLRDISVRGFLRADGMMDVEARLTDTKTYNFGNDHRSRIEAGEALHGMALRLTIDQDLKVWAAEAAMDHTPYAICPGAAPNFARLAGLTIGKGFLRGAAQRLGGPEGCTHLRELLQQIATVAIQTMFSVQAHKAVCEGMAEENEWKVPDYLVDTCYAYAKTGPLVGGRREREEV